jgi:2'-5' RNA ligase
MRESWRLFIAVELPDKVLDVIRNVQSDMTDKMPVRAVRWTRPEGIHLTLKFLGDVPVDQVDGVKAALSEATQGHGVFRLGAGGVGCFPNTQRPRVVWLGVTGDIQPLRALRDSVEKFVSPLGYPTEGRSFAPHLTLGRVARQASRDEVLAVGRLVEEVDVGHLIDWQVKSVSLMRSQLKPGGAVYTQVGEYRLEARDG